MLFFLKFFFGSIKKNCQKITAQIWKDKNRKTWSELWDLFWRKRLILAAARLSPDSSSTLFFHSQCIYDLYESIVYDFLKTFFYRNELLSKKSNNWTIFFLLVFIFHIKFIRFFFAPFNTYDFVDNKFTLLFLNTINKLRKKRKTKY